MLFYVPLVQPFAPFLFDVLLLLFDLALHSSWFIIPLFLFDLFHSSCSTCYSTPLAWFIVSLYLFHMLFCSSCSTCSSALLVRPATPLLLVDLLLRFSYSTCCSVLLVQLVVSLFLFNLFFHSFWLTNCVPLVWLVTPLVQPIVSLLLCHNLSLGFATKARGVANVQAKRKPENRITYSRECRKVWGSEPSHSQGNSHFGKWSPGGLPKLQRAILGVKIQWVVTFFIPLESSWNVDVKMGLHCSFGHLKHKLWPKEGSGVKLAVWFPTTKSWESTRFTCLQRVCDIPLESSWREL
jgi:hypothetical protein